MIKFISENCILLISLLYLVLTLFMCAKLKNADRQTALKKTRNFAEMPLVQRHRLLLGGKPFKILLTMLTLVFAAVAFCRYVLLFKIVLSVVLSVATAVICSFVFFELVLFMSALLRKIISVKSAVLNTLFSSVLVIMIMISINLFCADSKISFESFVLAQASLLLCYAMIVLILILVLKEANDEHSELSLKNIWKSAFLTIILFLFVLSLMSSYCVSFDLQSVSGASLGAFDMFYYTVITFATVGYGDIVPVSFFAKAVSMLTVLTSILCLTVLLSEVVSVKRKNNK